MEGAYSRLGVGNDLFDGVQSLQRILCPTKDAFSAYHEILSEIKNHFVLQFLLPGTNLIKLF